jgi:hypothetical protein
MSDRPPTGPSAFDEEVTGTTLWDIRVFQPEIEVSKLGDIEAFCEGDEPNVTYTYLVENTGNEDLNDVTVVDSNCSLVTGPAGDNGDGLLNPDEIWTYTCTTQLTGTTLNIVDVNAVGLYTGVIVSDSNDWLVEELAPPTVVVNPGDATICDANEQEFCAEVTGGVGPFTYSWTKDGSPFAGDVNCITVSAAGVYCVTVVDQSTKCDANDCATLAVVPTPECGITGPELLCDTDVNTPITYCSDVNDADGYLWEIVSGPATIDGADDGICVDIIPSDLGTIVLKLSLFNDVAGDDANCWNSCEITINVEECGKTFCSFTQGAWGNAGGKDCRGM